MNTRRLALPLPVLLVVGALLLAAIGSGVAFGLLFMQRADLDAARGTALDTARGYAVTLTTYDYKRADQGIADVLDGATGEFRDQYSGASGALRQLITRAKATAKGTVLNAGVQSASEDRAEVLVFVDQSVTNAGEKRETDRNRMLLTLERHEERWLVSEVALR